MESLFEQDFSVILAYDREFLEADKWGRLNLWTPSTRTKRQYTELQSLQP